MAEEDPDAIAKIWIDPVDGLSEEAARAWVLAAKLNPAATDGAVDILLKLYRAYTEGDADLCEINPLILKPTGEVHALDAKVTLDGNAQFRHEGWEVYEATQVRDEREQAAHDKGLQYVGLEGSVGVIANGAGLAMSTVDIVNQVGGKPANFLDIGGGANAEVMAGALEVINNDPNVKSIFINIFGGITKGASIWTRPKAVTMPLEAFAHERIDFWMSQSRSNSDYVVSAALLRAVYDIIDRRCCRAGVECRRNRAR